MFETCSLLGRFGSPESTPTGLMAEVFIWNMSGLEDSSSSVGFTRLLGLSDAYYMSVCCVSFIEIL